MSAIEDLKDLVAQMEVMYEKEYRRLERTIQKSWGPQGDTVPEDMLDMNGRPILLDTRLRLLEARIVLARYEERL